MKTERRRSSRHLVRSLDLEPLDVDGWGETTLREAQEATGAVFDAGTTVPTRFEGEEVVSEADLLSQDRCVFCDLSDASVLQVRGEDRLAFLHNQSTASVEGVETGRVVETAFVTAKAGMIDAASLLVQKQSVLVLASAGGAARLAAHLEKYIFPRDDVVVSDVSSNLSVFSLLGSGSTAVMERLGLAHDLGQNRQVLVSFQGYPLCIARATVLGVPGYTWIVDNTIAVEAWELLLGLENTAPIGSAAYEALRIEVGRPKMGSELTEDWNPLEAGLLGRCLDVEKGCSIGQEVIKRVHAKNGITRRLWGLSSEGLLQEGEDILHEGKKVGTVTSACEVAGGGSVALGYVRTRVAGAPFSAEGKALSVGGVVATGASLTYTDYPTALGEGEGEEEGGEEEGGEEEARRRKQEEMKARMEEWLEQQSKNK